MMIAPKSESGLSRFFRRPPEIADPAVLEREEFQRLLQRERLRADRNSETFSLVAMTSRNLQHGQKLFPELVRVLHTRLRATDDVGWIEKDRLGILLPDTPSAGAWTVVDHIVHLLRKDVFSPICEVYTYPSFDDAGEALEDRRIDGKFDHHPVGDGVETSAGGVSREVRRMESLFALSMPTWKRAMDIFGALAGLIVLSPLLALIGLAVKWTSPGPVFFTQLRVWYLHGAADAVDQVSDD